MERTGETGLPDHAQVAFHPPLLLVAFLVLGFVLRWMAPLSFLDSMVSSSAGPAVVVVSFALFFWAFVTMRRGEASIPTREPTNAIVMSGPYRLSRNPIYLSMVVLQMGTGIWANSIWFVLLAVASVVLLAWGVISREERYLERKFGERYTSYKADVRRWL